MTTRSELMTIRSQRNVENVALSGTTKLYCHSCKEYKPLDWFGTYQRGKTGNTYYYSHCIDCDKKIQHDKKAEKVKERAEHIKNNKRTRVGDDTYLASVRYRFYCNVAKKANKAVHPNFTKEFVQDLYNKATKCFYCGEKLHSLDQKGLVMRNPPSRGGDFVPENYAVTCAECSARKGKMTDEEFKSYVKETDLVVEDSGDITDSGAISDGSIFKRITREVAAIEKMEAKKLYCQSCEEFLPLEMFRTHFHPQTKRLQYYHLCKKCNSKNLKLRKEKRLIVTQEFYSRVYMRHKNYQVEAKKLKMDFHPDLTYDYFKQLYEKSDSCFYCDRELKNASEKSLVMRQYPKYGGLFVPGNFAVTCTICSLRKRRMSEEDFVKYVDTAGLR